MICRQLVSMRNVVEGIYLLTMKVAVPVRRQPPMANLTLIRGRMKARTSLPARLLLLYLLLILPVVGGGVYGQICQYNSDSIYRDKVGGVTPYSETIGTGKGFVLRDGFAIAAKWSRPSGDQGTTWTTEDGEEIKFAAGQVWIALTDKAPVFKPVAAANNEDATPPQAK